VRSIPLEAPIKEGIDEWLAAAKITQGRIFRAIPQERQSLGERARRIGNLADRSPLCCPGGPRELCPHDARRSWARIYYDSQAPLKQIQFLLGHDKLDTTARYVNDEQKFGGEAVSKISAPPHRNRPDLAYAQFRVSLKSASV
jgi:integrase